MTQIEFQKIVFEARHGDSEAQFILGKLYDEGIIVDKNEKRALNWFLRSEQKGNPQAMFRLGEIFYYGNNHIKKKYYKSI